MAWARFTRNFDLRIAHHTTVAYLAGMRCSLTRAQLAEVLDAGAGVEIRTPRREFRDRLAEDPFAEA